jgi:cytosine/adenosine deaminase-related metal-dependent hydrolase
VGESFQDKSVESAARWVVESAEYGAHRLGHCVALGVATEFFRDTTRYEIAAERRDQLLFELERQAELDAAGYPVDADACARELRSLRDADDHAPVAAHYDAARLDRLRVFQDWCMERVRASGAIVESCPTSNLRIAGLGSEKFHPLPRFLRAGLAVTLGADDPGILQTDLCAEYDLAAGWSGVTTTDVERMKATAALATAERLSGRRGA